MQPSGSTSLSGNGHTRASWKRESVAGFDRPVKASVWTRSVGSQYAKKAHGRGGQPGHTHGVMVISTHPHWMNVEGATAGSAAAATWATRSDARLATTTNTATIVRPMSDDSRGDHERTVEIIARVFGCGGRDLGRGAPKVARGQVAEQLDHALLL